jgi:hypothetical protein
MTRGRGARLLSLSFFITFSLLRAISEFLPGRGVSSCHHSLLWPVTSVTSLGSGSAYILQSVWGETLDFFELVSAALAYIIAGVYLSTGVIFLFVRIAAAVGLRKEGDPEGGMREFLRNFH